MVVIRPLLDRFEMSPKGILSRLLQIDIERGVDPEALAIQRQAAVSCEGVVQHFQTTGKKGYPQRMATAQGNVHAPLEELERVLSSACFARSEGLSRLLRFLVERQLEGRESELKESLIGVEVYGRRPDYDPKQDSTCGARSPGSAPA